MTLVESILAIFLAGFAVQMISALAFSSVVSRKAEGRGAVTAFLRDALDAASRSAASTGDRSGDAVGFAYDVGRREVAVGGPARQGTGALSLTPAQVPLSSGLASVALLRTHVPAAVDLDAWVRVDPSASGDWRVGLAFGYYDPENHYRLTLKPTGLDLVRSASGSQSVLATQASAVVPGAWRRLRIVTSGTTLTAYLDGAAAFSTSDPAFAPASVGLIGEGAAFRVDDLILASAGGSYVLDFEDASPTASSAAFVAKAPYRLERFRAVTTVADAFPGSPGLKKISAAAEWEEDGRTKSASLETLKRIE